MLEIETTLDRVRKAIVDRLKVKPEEVVPEASFVDTLGADSLDAVDIMIGFETEFDIQIPDEDAEKIKTVGDAISYIDQKLAG